MSQHQVYRDDVTSAEQTALYAECEAKYKVYLSTLCSPEASKEQYMGVQAEYFDALKKLRHTFTKE